MEEVIKQAVIPVAEALWKRGWQIAVAESCTGGLLGGALTSIPGSSAFFYGGVVSYHNQAKIDLLDVKPDTLIKFGAVSEETAVEMAEGIRKRCGTQLGIAITGIAGPDGGSQEKPVGLVYFALATENENLTKRNIFTGDRSKIRMAAVINVLSFIKDFLEKVN